MRLAINCLRAINKKNCFAIRISGIFDFGSPVYIIRDPLLIKQLAVKEFDHFVDHKFMLDGDPTSLFGRALFNLRGQKWRGWYCKSETLQYKHKFFRNFSFYQT